MRDKIKIIYILGDGHSGSTILNLILGSHTQVEGVGELTAFDKCRWYLLADQTASDGRLCSCGAPISECEYWNKVIDRLRKAHSLPALEINSKNREQFENNNYAVMKAILEVSGKRILCDSSKDLHRLTRLLQGDCFDVSIVHIVRDARAVAYSYKKSGMWYKSQGLLTEERRKFYDFDNAAIRWQSTNISCFLECQKRRTRYICIRYEDLVADPGKYIAKILEKANLSFESSQLIFWEHIHHHLGGNIARFKTRKEIKTDNSYLNGLSDDEWRRATRLAHYGIRLFGYPLKKGIPFQPLSNNLIKEACRLLPIYLIKYYLTKLVKLRYAR